MCNLKYDLQGNWQCIQFQPCTVDRGVKGCGGGRGGEERERDRKFMCLVGWLLGRKGGRGTRAEIVVCVWRDKV